MDPFTLSVISGIVANAISGLFASAEQDKAAPERDNLKQQLTKNKALEQEIAVSAATIAKHLKGDNALQNRLKEFLVSPEVESIVRQMYSLRIYSDFQDIETARLEFAQAASLFLDYPIKEAESLVGPLFNILLFATDQALSKAAHAGSTTAHESLSNRRQRLLQSEIASVKKSLEFLQSPYQATIGQINEYDRKLRGQVLTRHSYITPPHFDTVRKILIDDLYVSPDLTTEPMRQAAGKSGLSLENFLATSHRAIILGDPGGGKSTLSLKICHDLAKHFEARLLGGRRVTPILIILREYGSRKRTNPCSLVEYIEIISKSIYQVAPPSGAIEHLLLMGRLAIIFDGLDELLDTSFRQEVSGDIESFCNLYLTTPVLVTSRRVGYEQAPLDVSIFPVAQLAPFSNNKVREYAQKWFSTESDNVTQSQQIANTFLNESAVVPDLRSNPLMLALMCNIYRGENYIPQNRPDVYEKCATMLFERWDKSRGIHSSLPFEAHLRPAMMYIAFWIYSNEELQSGVTEQSLIRKASEYLMQWRFDDAEEALKAAQEFVEFCRGRAWVFTDVGTTKSGERLYQYTHRTFLEYFSGFYLTRTYETAEALGIALLPRIIAREWDVVAQLAFQIKSKSSEGAADKLLTLTIETAERAPDMESKYNLLSFSARCLEFLVPSPRIINLLTRECLSACINWGAKWLASRGNEQRTEPSSSSEPFHDLLNCSPENWTLVSKQTEELLVVGALGTDDIISYLCLEVGLNLGVWSSKNRSKNSTSRLTDRIYQATKDRIINLSDKYLLLCLNLLLRENLEAKRLIQVYSPQGLMERVAFATNPSIEAHSVASLLVTLIESPEEKEPSNFVFEFLNEIGNILTKIAPPFFERIPRMYFDYPQNRGRKRGERLPEHRRALTALFIILASTCESIMGDLDWTELSRSFWMGSLVPLLRSRSEETKVDDLENIVLNTGLDPDDQGLAMDWAKGEVSFVKHGPEKN